MAAAVLEYFAEFKTELSMNQCTIAARIANAMTAGGFKVQTERNKQISSRTVQDWKILYASGKRPRRKKRDACVIKAFEEIVKLLKKGRGEKSAAAYFEEALADITMRCRHHSE